MAILIQYSIACGSELLLQKCIKDATEPRGLGAG